MNVVTNEMIYDSEKNIRIYSMDNGSISLEVSNLGCRILNLECPDEKGKKGDVLLGLDNFADYKHDTAYFGAVLGRVANRIKNAEFVLNNKTYKLAANNACNHLHGGVEGFDKKLFQAESIDNGLRFCYLSKAGEEGYPGNLKLVVEYTLKDSSLIINYVAECDQDTVVNFANHMYFNLTGDGKTIRNHLLKINADKICCVDNTCMATGDKINVANTPFDFREFKTIEECLLSQHNQLDNAKGLDHPYIISNKSKPKIYEYDEINGTALPYQAFLNDPISKRMLKIYTTTPAIHVYTGNYLADGCIGKNGVPYDGWSGVALETEALPNAINTDDKDTVILRKGEIFKSQSIYSFELVK